ncbi:hypothetical protein [Actinomadura sp. WMMB 499]|uniref:hypothetical protein n=1 Tax=Actinomadura sp. WMMB 499 TaxID=1219491 RepID=UPI0012457923|nr:hypothetical protein [Actinomadura sp. WMMB 499]QFG22103.1 hypothetical protein F7P10_14175 [Actinomadura sp. WMMB 499]
MQVDPCGPRPGAPVPESRAGFGAAPAGTAGRATGTTRLGIDAAACAINEHAPAPHPRRAGRADHPLIRQFTAKIRSDREVPE